MFSAPTTERESVPKGRKRVGEGKIPPILCVDEVPTNDDTSVIILLFPSTVYLSLIPTKPPSRDPIHSGRERKRRGEDWRKATCGTLQIYNYKHTQKRESVWDPHHHTTLWDPITPHTTNAATIRE